MSSHTPALTSTSYTILGLLAIQPHSTYELAQQMARTYNQWWPRARSKIYEEPKTLVAHGLANATKESVGKRTRTVYTITAKGRRALSIWLKVPGDGPSIEFEQLTKVFLADQGTRTDALATINATKEWAATIMGEFADAARPYAEGTGPFPDRLAPNLVVSRFLLDFYTLVHEWAKWAERVVKRWPEDVKGAAPELSVLHDVIERGDAVRDDRASHGRTTRD